MRKLILFALLMVIPSGVFANKLERYLSPDYCDYSYLHFTDGSSWYLNYNGNYSPQCDYEGLLLTNGYSMSFTSIEEFPANVKVTIEAGGTVQDESNFQGYNNYNITLICDGQEERVSYTPFNQFMGSVSNLDVMQYEFELNRNGAGPIEISISADTQMPTAYLFIRGITLEYEFQNPVITEIGEVVYDGHGQGLGDDIKDVTNDNIPQTGIVVNNILYTLGKDDGSYVDEELGWNLVTLNTPTQEVPYYDPGTPNYAKEFKGMTFIIPAGVGTLYVDAQTLGDGLLNVEFNGQKKKQFSTDGVFKEIAIPYAFYYDTYVYIYHSEKAASATASPRAPGRKLTTTTSIKGLRVNAQTIGAPPTPPSVTKTLRKEDIKVVDGHIIVDDPSVTAYADDIFEGLTDITYVDLSKTSITGKYVYRKERRPFNALPDNTIVYLPYGNYPQYECTNIVFGEVCRNMLLTDGSFDINQSFVALNVKQDVDYTTKPDKTTTIVLPFALDEEQAASLGTFYEFGGIEQGGVRMKAVKETEAYKPYMLKATVDKFNAEMVIVDPASESEELFARRVVTAPEFIGVLKPTIINSDAYVFDADGKYSLVTSATSLATFTAYVKALGATATPLNVLYGDVLKGDANGDGLINVSDIVEIVNYIMGKPSNNFKQDAADVSGDGEVNVTDIVKVVTIIMSGE